MTRITLDFYQNSYRTNLDYGPFPSMGYISTKPSSLIVQLIPTRPRLDDLMKHRRIETF
jgi:hypothetical protein